MGDIGPLLAAGYEWNPEAGAEAVSSTLIARLPGEPWKGNPPKAQRAVTPQINLKDRARDNAPDGFTNAHRGRFGTRSRT